MEAEKSLTSTYHQALPLHLLLFPSPESHPRPPHGLTSQVCFPSALPQTVAPCPSAHPFAVPPASSPFTPLIKRVGVQTSHRCLPNGRLLGPQIFTPLQESFCASLSACNPSSQKPSTTLLVSLSHTIPSCPFNFLKFPSLTPQHTHTHTYLPPLKQPRK